MLGGNIDLHARIVQDGERSFITIAPANGTSATITELMSGL
jgi:hypothetical protein